MNEDLTYVKELMASNTVDALNVLDSIIDRDSDIFNEFISFKKRYFENLRFFQNGLIDYENFNLTFNKLTIGILTLIDRISEYNKSTTNEIALNVYESNKGERLNRLIINQIINLDDNSKNIEERRFWKVVSFPFIGIIMMFSGFLLIFTNKSPEDRLSINPLFLISIVLLGVFGIAQLIKVFFHWRKNKGNLPRIHEQLKIVAKGSYDLIFDSIFRTIQDLGMIITDYSHLEGTIKTEYRNMMLFERLYSSLSGEQIIIKIINNIENNIEINITSTSKSILSYAHESDFFNAQGSINRKNLQKIQKLLISNLSKI